MERGKQHHHYQQQGEEQEEEEAVLTPAQLLHLAETHLRLGNFSLSRQYALESSSHHPLLHRATQIATISDILLTTSTTTTTTTTNWYSVLQLDTFCSDFTLINSHFHQLHSLLSPSNLPFTSQALTHLSQGHSCLSTPSLKSQLDSQLTLLLSNQKHLPSDHTNGAFWTFCPYCFYVYQYARVYEGCCLRCQNGTCRRAFHGVALTSLPKMELDKGRYFGCFGYFPLGFSPFEDGERGKFKSWSPIVGMFPVKRMGKACAGRTDLDGDDGFGNFVEVLDDSDDELESPVGGNVGKSRGVKRKSVALNARKLMGRRKRSSEEEEDDGSVDWTSDSDEYGGDGVQDGGSKGFGNVNGVASGSGCRVDAEEDVNFFEEGGEIFVGFGAGDEF